MRAQPFIWTQVERPRPSEPDAEAIPADPPPPLGFGAAAFGAMLGPELSRTAGVRVAVRPIERSPDSEAAGPRARGSGQMLAIGRLPLRHGSLLFTIDAESGAALLNRMLGSRAVGYGVALASLPPASGSWITFARLVGGACQQAAIAGNCVAAGAILVPPRPMAPDLADAGTSAGDPFAYALDVDGIGGMLVVHPLLLPGAVPISPRGNERNEREVWQGQAHALTMALDLPVTLRLAERSMNMNRIASLKPGDVIPIDSPRQVDVMVGGRPFARLPVAGGTPGTNEGDGQ